MSTQQVNPSTNHRDVTNRSEWLTAQTEALRIAASGAPLYDSLRVLVKATHDYTDGDARCAFYVVDPTGTMLHHVVGMPAKYAQCVDGFNVSRDSLACGLAVYSGQPVITPDVTREPLWQRWLWLAAEYNYRGCWSFPVREPNGKVIGTLAMYFEEPRHATLRDHEFVALITQTAGIIVSRDQSSEVASD